MRLIAFLVVLVFAPAAAHANGPRNFIFDASFLDVLRFRYEASVADGATNQRTYDEPGDANYRFAQSALWGLVETAENRTQFPKRRLSVDVRFAIAFYKATQKDFNADPNNITLPAYQTIPDGAPLPPSAELTPINNHALAMRDALNPIRAYSDGFAAVTDQAIYRTVVDTWNADKIRAPGVKYAPSVASYRRAIDTVLAAATREVNLDPNMRNLFKIDDQKRWDAYHGVVVSAVEAEAARDNAKALVQRFTAPGSSASPIDIQTAQEISNDNTTYFASVLNVDNRTIDPVKFIRSYHQLYSPVREYAEPPGLIKGDPKIGKTPGDPGKGK